MSDRTISIVERVHNSGIRFNLAKSVDDPNGGTRFSVENVAGDRTTFYASGKIINSNKLLQLSANDTITEDNATTLRGVKTPEQEYDAANKKYVDQRLPSPATAQIGQIVKVKSVDESGKITETETVDMPSGGAYTLPIASPTVLGGVKPIAKTGAMTQGVGVDAAGALWTAVGGSGGGFPKFETIYEHTVTADEATNIILFSITNTDVPNLGDYNVFVGEIEFAENTALTKWVRMKINNGFVSQICGTSASTSKIYSCSANRLFGHWIGSSVYNVANDGPNVTAVIIPSINCYMLEHDNDATSIGIGSYGSDFGLVEGTILRIYAAK